MSTGQSPKSKKSPPKKSQPNKAQPKRRAITSRRAPPPAGTYSQAIVARGDFVFISGQTPRRADGVRLGDVDFRAQAVQTMENLRALSEAAGCSLAEQCVQVTVYLRNFADRFEFDEVFATYMGETPPARAIVQSDFVDFDIEVTAVLVK